MSDLSVGEEDRIRSGYTGGANNVVRSATYDEGYKAGLAQAVIELEAEAVLADRSGLTGTGDYLRALADKMRAVRDR
jgi:hypothetical protein